MQVTEKNGLIINIDGKTLYFTEKELIEKLTNKSPIMKVISEEPNNCNQSFTYEQYRGCVNYERDNIEQEGKTIEKKDFTEVKPEYYNKYKITPLEFILANNIPFVESNIIKYVSRYKDKNGLQDLKKAKEYLEILIKENSK